MAIQNVTATPTATNANNLTMASSAIAVTTPSWRSDTFKLRVPKSAVNNARPIAITNAIIGSVPAVPDDDGSLAKTEKDKVSDCS